jgi:hypothetical protein
MEPLNLKLLFATDEETRSMRPIKVLDITDGMTANFHPDGLFSTEIFGKKGGAFRNRLFSYIDLRVPIIHPTLFKTLIRMKSLYPEIMAGKAYAIFDEKLKDFVPSTIMEGNTGYEFFVSRLKDIVFEDRKAASRKAGIKLLTKYLPNIFITKLLVIPAGGRCKAGTAGAGGHGAGTAYRRPCSGNADAARQPRACQGSSGRAGACTQGGYCREATAGKARAPAGAAACCGPQKAA